MIIEEQQVHTWILSELWKTFFRSQVVRIWRMAEVCVRCWYHLHVLPNILWIKELRSLEASKKNLLCLLINSSSMAVSEPMHVSLDVQHRKEKRSEHYTYTYLYLIPQLKFLRLAVGYNSVTNQVCYAWNTIFNSQHHKPFFYK